MLWNDSGLISDLHLWSVIPPARFWNFAGGVFFRREVGDRVEWPLKRNAYQVKDEMK